MLSDVRLAHTGGGLPLMEALTNVCNMMGSQSEILPSLSLKGPWNTVDNKMTFCLIRSPTIRSHDLVVYSCGWVCEIGCGDLQV